MAERGLQNVQFRAAIQAVRCVAVSQPMRADWLVETGAFGGTGDPKGGRV